MSPDSGGSAGGPAEHARAADGGRGPGADYQQAVSDSVTDAGRFVRAVFSGRRRGHTVPWERV